MKKKVVLIDSHAFLHRAYHAMGGFYTFDGRPTGALFGYIKMILKMRDELKPDYAIACFDRKEATFRHEAYEGYKSHRKKSDDDLVTQLNLAPTIAATLDLPVYSLAGYEADDLLGTIVEKIKQNKFKDEAGNDLEVYIASGDMDTMQLIDRDDHVKVFTLKKGVTDTIVYNYKSVIDKYGFRAEQIPDYKGLRGDASDNIIGITGIGEKTATIIISIFENIENIYKTFHQDFSDDREGFIKYCKDKAAEKGEKLTDRLVNLLIDGEEEALFSKTLATIRCDAPIEFSLPERGWLKDFDDTEFNKMCDEYEFRTLKNTLLKKSVSPLFNKEGLGVIELNISGANLEQILNEESGAVIENKKEDILDKKTLDKLKLMTNLLNSEMTNPNLEDILAFANTGEVKLAEEVLIERLKNENLFDLYLEVESKVSTVIESMCEFGIRTDAKILKEQSTILHAKINELTKKIYDLAGEEFNISSPKQLGVILYEKLGLGKKVKKTATGAYSTNASELEKLKGTHEIVELIMEYREITKLTSTYVDNIPEFIKEDGKIHPEFIQTGAATGRFSCEHPNLQNLPAKSELGLLVRKAFLASPGYKLVSLDYSQIDLRSAAILSGDENLIKVFQNSTDVHTGVAAQVFKVGENEVTREMRGKAKAINFGILYGMGVSALKDAMGVERAEAQAFYDEYKSTFVRLMQYLDEVKGFAYINGYTETLLGRRRHIPLIKSRLPFLKAQGERIAINAPVQGTTADILKLAMIDVYEYVKTLPQPLPEFQGGEQIQIQNSKIKILLQIHDELILEVADDVVEKEKENLKNILEQVFIKRLSTHKETSQNIINKKDKIIDTALFHRLKNKEKEILSVPLIANIKVGESLYDIK